MARQKKRPLDVNNLPDKANTPSTWPNDILPVRFSLSHDADMESDFSDLKFYENDGKSNALDHWVQSFTADTSAEVWVEVPLVNGATSKTIWLYYDDPNASDAASPTGVFDYFEGFDDPSVIEGTFSENLSSPTLVNENNIIQSQNQEIREQSNAVLVDGTYYLIVTDKIASDNRDGVLYKATDIDGPWSKVLTLNGMEDPYIVHDGSTWYVYAEDYQENSGDHIVAWTAPDIEGPWTREGIVLSPGGTGWRENLVGSPTVEYDGSTFHMLLEGFTSNFDPSTGYASSPDGLSWSYGANNPVSTNLEVIDDFRVVDGTGYYTAHISGGVLQLFSGPSDPSNWESASFTEIGDFGDNIGASAMFIEGEDSRVTMQIKDYQSMQVAHWASKEGNIRVPTVRETFSQASIRAENSHFRQEAFNNKKVSTSFRRAVTEVYEESRVLVQASNAGSTPRYLWLNLGEGSYGIRDAEEVFPSYQNGYATGVFGPDFGMGLVISEVSSGSSSQLDTGSLSSTEAQNEAEYELQVRSGDELQFLRDGTQKMSAVDATHSPPHELAIGQGSLNLSHGPWLIDWAIVTKRTTASPSVTVNSEQEVSISGTLALTDGSEIVSATGKTKVSGTSTITDQGEIATASGAVITEGSVNLTDRGEILSLEGQVSVTAITGTLSITNGRQSVSLSGATKNQGTLNLTDRGERLVLIESKPGSGPLRLAVLDARLVD
jgi:hypothetical protein